MREAAPSGVLTPPDGRLGEIGALRELRDQREPSGGPVSY
jgi:hypothetical protein